MLADEMVLAQVPLKAAAEWAWLDIPIKARGVHALYLCYSDEGYFDLESIGFTGYFLFG